VTGTRRQKLAVGLALELLLVALVVAIVALGNRTWSRGFVIYVDFDRLDNLKEGAEVRISGQAVGRVLAIGRAQAGEPRARAALRTRLWLERDRAALVRRSSLFYLSAKGVIGERTIEVGPSPGERLAEVGPGEAYRGIDPPMIDRLIQKGYANLRATLALMRELRPDLRELGATIEAVRTKLEAIAPADRLRRLRASLEAAVAEAGRLALALRAGSDEGRAPRRILRELDAIAARREALARTAEKAGALATRGEELASLLGPEERQRLARSLERLQLASARAAELAGLVERVVTRVKEGRGTIGRLLTDVEMSDEIKEAHRVLKESPWRALAKPPRERAPRGAPRRRAE
jgi:ABC-type transporter Mla subunit MlaD